ncbi:F-box protein [Prunus yedoensis var. nudiflora]|uniref:F-box protein n=1 Tax=Prunus yedoensis var. nudiflora TaxID=2094558 RepID=A0A314YVJ6_PRUYE|nr:F-box protein [Prunus yedoensis var. nudiflora]
MMMNDSIDDLPELLLVEIICRLSCIKFVFQCKCVSKRWCELISSSHFVGQYVRRQRDLKKPILGTLVVQGTFFHVENEDGLMSLQLPVISEATAEQKLFVVGACNDLVLCCPSKLDHREYYICNPYTKKWVALPPPPRIHIYVSVGFICDPYYNYNSSSSFDNDVCINAEYRWRVVRLRPEFYVDIFFSETGEWRESANVVCGSRKYFDIVTAGVACNGKLYFSGSDTLHPPIFWSWIPSKMYLVLGACRGHLRVSEFVLGNHLSVWELDAGDDNLKWRLVVDQVPFFQMDSSKFEDPLMPQDEWLKSALGFHPNIEAIYVDARKIVRCNFGARMLELVPEIPSRGPDWHLFYIHPFVLPWWPTPVPSL